MTTSRSTSLLLAAAVLVNVDMHKGPRKDWLVIFLGAVIVVVGIVNFVVARREARGRSRSERAQ